MEIISNAEGLFREIKNIEVHNAKNISFIDAYRKTDLDLEPILTFKNILPEDFSRSIRTKYNQDNKYCDIDISFALYTQDARLKNTARIAFGKRKFAIKLVTNTDELWLGNEREPLSIELNDGFRDDNSGTDRYEVSIYGTTIIDPNFVL